MAAGVGQDLSLGLRRTDVADAEAQALILSSGSANGGTACGNDADGTGGDGTCCRNAEEIAAWREVL